MSAVPEDDGTIPLSAYEDEDKPKGNGSGGEPLVVGKLAEPLDWPKLAPHKAPDRLWAIKGWLGYGHATLLVGPGGIGKTLLSQQMGSCLALSRPFIEQIERPHRVLMWACEDDHDELWRRQEKIARWCKAGLEEFHEYLTIVPRHGLDNALVSTEFGKLLFTPRIEELRQQAHDLDADVVILDNVGQLYGGSENDRHSVTVFLNTLVGALSGKAILLLAHPSRSMGSEFSGSSAWENVARSRWYFAAHLPGTPNGATDEEPAEDVRYLSRRKANYSAKDWRRMTYADGALTPDAVETEGGLIESIRHEKARTTVIEGLKRLAERGISTSHGTRAANYLPKAIMEYKLNDGLASPELSGALRGLILEGRIKEEVIGRTTSRNPKKGLICVF